MENCVGKYLVTGKKHVMYDRDLCYTNQLKIAMRNDKVAEKGIDILVTRLLRGFEYDKSYNFSPSLKIDYYGAAEPPVRCGVSHLSELTEPLLEIAI